MSGLQPTSFALASASSARRDDNPVIFLETKLLYVEGGNGPVPEENYAIPIGKADVKREGTDVTVVATMAMVPRALSAARTLEREGISVEVVDPRTLKPLDEETILNSVMKTNRCVTVEEGWPVASIGNHISAVLMQRAFDYLDAPVINCTGKDVPMPYAANLEKLALTSTEEVMDAVRQVTYR